MKILWIALAFIYRLNRLVLNTISAVNLARCGVLAATLTGMITVEGRGAPFSIAPNNVGISAIPGPHHIPIELPITYTPSNFDLSRLSCSSDSAWVSPTIVANTGKLKLSFLTGTHLVDPSSTATITVTDGIDSVQVFVKASYSTMNLVALEADPSRSRVYGLQQNGLRNGGVLAYDPVTAAPVGYITVGEKPTDLVVNRDGSELLVICSAAQKIYVINLSSFSLKEVINLPVYQEWGVADSSAEVAYGPDNTIYYTDGAWAPALHVFNRNNGTVIQNLQTINSDLGYGFGGIAVSPDQNFLFTWGQYGWHAGISSSCLAKYAIGSDGKLSFASATPVGSPSSISRDPINAPTFVAGDGTTFVVKQFAVSSADLGSVIRRVPTPVFSTSPNAEILNTATAIYQRSSGEKLADLPVPTQVQAVTFDYSRLVYFNSTLKTLGVVDLSATLDPNALGLVWSPAHKAITLSPQSLDWTPLPGVSRYAVYIGTSRDAVFDATPASQEYKGVFFGVSYAVPSTLAAGTKYYWRVDPVTDNDTSKGIVRSFTVSPISASVSSINATTVAVNRNFTVPVALASASPGMSWTATCDASWVKLSASAGVTPATFTVTLDASAVAESSETTVHVGTPQGSFSIPISLTVDPLKITMMQSREGTTKVYAISEDTLTESSRAYLLEIDSLSKTVSRVVGVGANVTDFAIHPADNRVYVTNWRIGALLGVNLEGFNVERTYAFAPPTSAGYTENDVYRVAASTAGRVVIEEQDQWIAVSLLDTEDGAELKRVDGYYSGAGAGDPTGRYHYHGERGGTSAEIIKLDLAADMAKVAEATAPQGHYTSSGSVRVSENGQRVFWNGTVYDANLVAEWLIGDEIYSVSHDGRYAFGENEIYDVQRQTIMGPMPVATTVSSYNSTTGRLVVQNGTNLAFYTPVAPGLMGTAMSPADNAIVVAPSRLEWTALPQITAYRVYLGTSQAAVSQATTASSLYLGEVSTTSVALPISLSPGSTYYWRVDPVMGSQVIAGDVASFRVSSIAPSISEISGRTVTGDPAFSASVTLFSSSPGLSWTASSSAPWISFVNVTGTTPGPLGVQLDASYLSQGQHQATITIANGSESFAIPVQLQVDPINLTVIKSDPASTRLYAVSEATVASGPSRAYLLEIDSRNEAISRVTLAGSSVTDIALHPGDNRIYVTNWRSGMLLGFDRDTLQLSRTYPFKAFTGTGYGENDVYRIAAAGPGRLIVEEQDQWIDIILFDTYEGKALSTAFVREGGGAFLPDLRYYIHGENNSSGAMLRKFDISAGVLTPIASASPPNGSQFSYGSRTVVVSESGNRIFWAGGAYTPQLAPEWAIGDLIYSTTADGRFAVGASKIYDVSERRVVLGLPASGVVSAVNSKTNKLVLQNGASLGFYSIDPSTPLAVPELTLGTVTPNNIVLHWLSNTLQTGFTLQMKPTGAASWSDISASLGADLRTITVPNLATNRSYDFRIKADSPFSSSPWSSIVSATTLAYWPTFGAPVVSRHPFNRVVMTGGSTAFEITADGNAPLRYYWQVSLRGTSTWTDLANDSTYTGVNTPTLLIGNAPESLSGASYRCQIFNDVGYAVTNSGVLSVSSLKPTVTLQPAHSSVFAGHDASFGVRVTGSTPLRYYWQVSPRGSATWTDLADTFLYRGTRTPTLEVANVTPEMNGHNFRCQIFNDHGYAVSESAILTALPATPVISTQPASTSIVSGGSAEFTVRVTGAPEIRYYWQVSMPRTGGWVDLSDGGPYSGTRTQSLSISAATLALNGAYYRCQIFNPAGYTNSESAILAVNVPAVAPSVVTQPRNFQANAGGAAAVSLVASGTGPMAYYWQVSAPGTAGWADLADNDTYSGTRTPNLILTNVSQGMNGAHYRCQIFNTAGYIVSESAVLSVQAAASPPSIRTQPSSQAFSLGGASVFTIDVEGPSLAYYWQVSLPGTGTWMDLSEDVIHSGTRTPILTITHTTLAMSNYHFRCQIFNPYGYAVSESAVLTVTSPPVITAHPADRTLIGGSNTSFSVDAAGAGPLRYYWQVSVPNSTSWTDLTDGGFYSGTRTATLSVTGAWEDMNNYVYRCQVFNDTGYAVSDFGRLIVPKGVPPWIVAQPVSATSEIGGNVTIHFVADGFGPFRYYWQVSPKGSGSWTDLTDSGVYSGTRTNALVITGATADMNGHSFRCQVFASAGYWNYVVTDSAVLTVGNPTAPSISLQPTDKLVIAGDSAAISVVAAGSSPLLYYWQVSVPGSTSWTDLANGDGYAGARTATLSITTATVGMNGYHYRCQIFNPLGYVVSESSILTVTVPAPGLSMVAAIEAPYIYQDWLLESFTPVQLADPDLVDPNSVLLPDGLTNLTKYALGLDPHEIAEELPVTVEENGRTYYVYKRPVNRSDILYSAEISTDGGASWSSSGLDHQRHSSSDGWETWTASTPTAATPILFRLLFTHL